MLVSCLIDAIVNQVKEKAVRGKVLVIVGETGSGKSTEVPKLLLDTYGLSGDKLSLSGEKLSLVEKQCSLSSNSLVETQSNSNSLSSNSNSLSSNSNSKSSSNSLSSSKSSTSHSNSNSLSSTSKSSSNNELSSYSKLSNSNTNPSNTNLRSGWEVVVTQPRRVAAVALARRVSSLSPELGVDGVGYAIRFKDTCTKRTRIKYVTDGVLLKWLEGGRVLDTVVVDEVHERTVRTDVLLGLLKDRIKSLRLVLMSATAELEMIKEYFTRDGIEVEVVEIPGRKFPVEIKYLPRRSSDYIQMAQTVISMIVRGYELDNVLSNSNSNSSSKSSRDNASSSNASRDNASKDNNPIDLIFKESKTSKSVSESKSKSTSSSLSQSSAEILKLNQDNGLGMVGVGRKKNRGVILVFLSGLEDIDDLYKSVSLLSEVEVLKLHSSLEDAEQKRIFTARSQRIRVILSTNIAETSLTIPGVRWVIDCGVEKISVSREGVESLGIVKISKSSADQRAGRAGRTGPGVCYRLYTQNTYQMMDKQAAPEILRTDISAVCLSLIRMDKDPGSFDFLANPGESAILGSLRELFVLGLIDKEKKITEMGRKVAGFPLSPSLGKFLVAGRTLGVSCTVAGVCALLSTGALFVLPPGSEAAVMESVVEDREKASDLTLCAALFFSFLQTPLDRQKSFCTGLGVSYREMRNAERIYQQLLALVLPKKGRMDWREEVLGGRDISMTARLCVLLSESVADRLHQAASAAFLTRVAESAGSGSYLHLYSKNHVWIHPGSVMFRKREGVVGFVLSSQTSKPYLLYVFPFTNSSIELSRVK
ncbi:ATP-dependent RNA helicase DHX36 [Nematocida homosporus]|uniref:ATP-dependent RNA helicase DHX36 n=1 Tax=Nematocida homosporus TaxID=1912981 RepID=UPI00221E5823|nr:ATP-dependent RNA helicase DHX36 [Nematocida homosporus]KAI5186102.1 ATP-dependent RNA helicase DHX36 [Nematocida homosporus]